MLDNINTPADLKRLSLDELNQLAPEIRQLLVDTVTRQGGHMASNLGDVELILALEYVFNPPEDKIVFDVGHQAYAHKILTGRREAFAHLREKDGPSGFTRRSESDYDAFSAGHASTALSAALGMARARDQLHQRHAVVAVLGDGALTGGMCYEALNDAGSARTPFIAILNDNEMSISHNVGALSAHLTRMRQGRLYGDVRQGMKRGLARLPVVGEPLLRLLRKITGSLRRLLLGEHFFEALGVRYLGPIDGHNLRTLVGVLRRAQRSQEPVLIHVVTQKGKGYSPAETAPDVYHGVSPSGQRAEKGVSSGKIAASTLVELAGRDERIVALTAAMPQGTGLNAFAAAWPARFYDVGIAEEHMITMAAGMAAGGLKPFVGIYSTFLQRGYDQLIHDVCLERLPVTLLIDRAGLVGPDGATHQGVFDLSFLTHMPGMTVASPSSSGELISLIRFSATHDGPMAIRYPRALPEGAAGSNFAMGQWQEIAPAGDAVILAVGHMTKAAQEAAKLLSEQGIRCGVVYARFIKPMDEKMLLSIPGHALVVTLEDNAVTGGFGALVGEFYAAQGRPMNLMRLGVPDAFIPHGTVSEQMAMCGLTPAQIAQAIAERLAHKSNSSNTLPS